MTRPTHVTVGFVAEGVTARARLDWESAPDICQAIVDATPFTVRAHHATFSGSEIAAITPNLPQLAPANPTSDTHVGDLAYGYLLAEDHYGVDADFAEICWFYDIDSRPSMFTGPFPVSVFARFEDAAEFFAASRDMRLAGAKQIEVRSS
jgi:hypothetical protein